MAMKYDAEVVPVTITNAEYTRPFNFRIDVLHQFVRRYLVMPLFPIGPAVTQILFSGHLLDPVPREADLRVPETHALPGGCGDDDAR
jgi:hypothetical protein